MVHNIHVLCVNRGVVAAQSASRWSPSGLPVGVSALAIAAVTSAVTFVAPPARATRAACGDPGVPVVFVPVGTATGTFAVACGDMANANGDAATAIGTTANANGAAATATGAAANANGAAATATGAA